MTLKNKIKFLPKEDIKKAADDLLNKAYEAGIYDFNSPTPLDVIVENILNLEIRFCNLDKDNAGVLGALDLQNKIIWLDVSLDHTETGQFVDEARCNFTIAHEIGHNILHGNVILDNGLVAFHNETDPNTKNAETQANMFAAMVAMPSELMFQKWNKDFAYIENYNDAITAMVDFFRVSRESMQYRLKDLGLLTTPNY
ncbi:MAG: Zn-dependent peptidase ImmA (M78 family) [Rickettsiales bacterium]|jgi:Zn-dependent peptidase ImmA (M78 family)